MPRQCAHWLTMTGFLTVSAPPGYFPAALFKEERKESCYSPPRDRNTAGSTGSLFWVTLKCTWLPRVVSTMAVSPA